MTGRPFSDHEWRLSLHDGFREFAFEPEFSVFGRRAVLKVFEDDGNGGWEHVMGASFSADVIDEFGDYCKRLAAYLKGER